MHCRVGMGIGAAVVEKSMEDPQNIKNGSTLGSSPGTGRVKMWPCQVEGTCRTEALRFEKQ